jgi:hypothetical protein
MWRHFIVLLVYLSIAMYNISDLDFDNILQWS